MPKTKTRSAAKKRFKVTGTGRILRRPTMRSHNLEHKSSNKKRKFGRNIEVTPADEKTLKQLLKVK
jgi:large subunit ribosomal protein L35